MRILVAVIVGMWLLAVAGVMMALTVGQSRRFELERARAQIELAQLRLNIDMAQERCAPTGLPLPPRQQWNAALESTRKTGTIK